MAAPLRIERVIDLPRAIVWDAFVDPVLVEGWLDPALRLVDGEPAVLLRERRDPELLRLSSSELGELVIAAEELPGGTRGRSTRVSVEVVLADPRFAPGVRRGWIDRLDRLENLLRGHPADWREAPAAKRAAR